MRLNILIVAESASLKFGGEAALPLHYFRVLRERKIPTWLVVHARTRDELGTTFAGEQDRIFYVEDSLLHQLLWKLGKLLPERLANFSTAFVMRLLTQLTQRRVIRRLIREHGISVVHQPMPVSPKEPSMLFGLGVPVIIGPMNGGMEYPPGFKHMQSVPVRLGLMLGRRISNILNRLIPGKINAAVLLVANPRTRAALPSGVRGRVLSVVENGVDLKLWKTPRESRTPAQHTRYAFVGRLVDWKATDKLLIAFQQASRQAPMSLTIIGDGPERPKLEQLARELKIHGSATPSAGSVTFTGWMTQSRCAEQLQECDALVLPSLLECGGAVVLEAMAMAIPVIATAWGGPVDYLDETCGVLVEPTDAEVFVANMAAALVRVARDPKARYEMGQAGRNKVVNEFDWEAKVDRVLQIYGEAIAERTQSESVAVTR